MLYQPKSGTQKLKCQLTVNSATFLLDTSPLINFIDVLYNISRQITTCGQSPSESKKPIHDPLKDGDSTR